MSGIYINRNNSGYRYYNASYTATASTNDSNVIQVFNDDFRGAINGTMFWASTGTYSLETTSPIFVQNLSSIFITPMFKSAITINSIITWEWKSTSQILIRTYLASTGVLTNTGFTLNLEYRLYYNYVYSTYP
jgi:hypothetical protein